MSSYLLSNVFILLCYFVISEPSVCIDCRLQPSKRSETKIANDSMMKLRTMSHNTPSRQDLYHQYCLLSPMQVTKQDPCI